MIEPSHSPFTGQHRSDELVVAAPRLKIEDKFIPIIEFEFLLGDASSALHHPSLMHPAAVLREFEFWDGRLRLHPKQRICGRVLCPVHVQRPEIILLVAQVAPLSHAQLRRKCRR